MPRLTYATYLNHHYQLKDLWVVNPKEFSRLTSMEQLDLHKFFLPSLEKTDEELKTHRSNVLLADPSLANRAGKAYAKLMRGEQAPIKRFIESPRGDRRIYLRTVMRPEPDVDLLVKAFLGLAMQEKKREVN